MTYFKKNDYDFTLLDIDINEYSDSYIENYISENEYDFVLLGSIVTRIGIDYKQSKGIAENRGGKRGPENLWGSAATGAILAIMLNF